MEKTEKKIVKVIRVACLTTCSDDQRLYERGQRYSLPEDHCLMQYFERVRFTDNQAELGPVNVELAKGKEDDDK